MSHVTAVPRPPDRLIPCATFAAGVSGRPAPSNSGANRYDPAVATFEIEGSELRLRLSFVEKLEGVHGDIRVPLTAVSSVRSVPTAWPELRGIRAPGTGLPGVIAVGTRRGKFGRDFVVVHGQGPAVVVELNGDRYGRLVATVPDADAVAATIRTGTGLGTS